MSTEKLYYQDAYLTEFTASADSCEKTEKGWKIVLNRTAFYPEGGGQPADQGVLCTSGGVVHVLDVHEKDGVVFHICDNFVENGAEVRGQIDWARRFDHMQQHSGEHIISGILCRMFDCDNVGFHLGAETVTIDYNAAVEWSQVLEAQRLANEIVYADRPVNIAYPDPEALASLRYRSKKALSGEVRIVTFPDADCCACCGTHVRRAGEVGLIKVLSCQSFREGVRLEILCGRRAMAYYDRVFDAARQSGQRLSVKPPELLPAVERLEDELTAEKNRSAYLEKLAYAAIAAEYEKKGSVLIFQPPMKPDSVRRLADAVGRTCGGTAAVFAGENGQWSYALVQGQGEEVSGLVKRLNETLHGRGGGRNGFAQGSVKADTQEIRAFFGKEDGYAVCVD